MDCCFVSGGWDGWEGHGVGVGQKMRAVVKHLKQPPLASSSSSFMLRYFVSHPSECPTLACYPSFLPNSWYVGKQWVLYSSKCRTLLKGKYLVLSI